ncbi:MAG: protein kinase [Gammaproteobacteria bacterium]
MTDTNALPDGYRLNEYEIVRELGEGGFGITYLGYDHNLDKPIAVKEYLPSELASRGSGHTVVPRSAARKTDFTWGLERFLDEARMLARFDHPHIIRVHRFFEAHGTGYIVMEYAEGETLSELLKTKKRLTEGELGPLLLPILEGLERVHGAEVLHRDIKPGNIVVRGAGDAVLIDFGAARQAIGARSRSVTSIVTPGYAPIEQYSSKGHQGPWTDIYALGAVAYRALTGRDPDDATDRIRQDPLVPAVVAGKGQGSEAFLKAIDWALAVDERERPQSIAQWRAAFETPVNRVAAAPVSRRPTAAPSSAAPVEAGKGKLRWVMAGLVGLGVLAGGAWWWTQQPSATPGRPVATENDDAARVGAIALNGEVQALMERVESTGQEVDTQLATARAERTQAEDAVRAANGAEARRAAEDLLRQRAARVEELELQGPLVQKWIANGPQLVKVRGQLAVANADLAERNYSSAAAVLSPVKEELLALQKLNDSLRDAISARSAHRVTVAAMNDRLAKAGLGALNAGEVTVAEQALAAGDFAAAALHYQEAARNVQTLGKDAFDKAIAEAKARAAAALNAKKLADARAALDEASKLDTWRQQL